MLLSRKAWHPAVSNGFQDKYSWAFLRALYGLLPVLVQPMIARRTPEAGAALAGTRVNDPFPINNSSPAWAFTINRSGHYPILSYPMLSSRDKLFALDVLKQCVVHQP